MLSEFRFWDLGADVDPVGVSKVEQEGYSRVLFKRNNKSSFPSYAQNYSS